VQTAAMGQIPRSTERILVRIAMRYNKTDTCRDCCYRSLLEIVSLSLGNITFRLWRGVQYFPNIGETISISDLNTSHYLYSINVTVTFR